MAVETRPGFEGCKDEAAFRFDLSRPVTDAAYGELSELTFREPNVADIVRVGDPVKYLPGSNADDISFDEEKMVLMLARLSGVTPRTIESMCAFDWKIAAWSVARFFVQPPSSI